MLCFQLSLGGCVGWRQSAAGPETTPAQGGSALWWCSIRGKLPVIPFPCGILLLRAVLWAVNTGTAKFWCCTSNDKTCRQLEYWDSFVKITVVHYIGCWSVNSNAIFFWLSENTAFLLFLFEKNFSLTASQNKRFFWTYCCYSVHVYMWPLFLLSSSSFLLPCPCNSFP